jgi:hypothetical protein
MLQNQASSKNKHCINVKNKDKINTTQSATCKPQQPSKLEE